MSKHTPFILVVDDEPKYLYIVQLNLKARGFEVLTTRNGQEAIELAAGNELDLIILDVRMPGMSGFEVCQRIRQFSTVPIIMLTALVDDVDKVKGLNLGADDYVTKPFNIEELLARIKAKLRRVSLDEQPEKTSAFQVGNLRVDPVQQRMFVSGEEVPLTATEYRLLSELVNQAGRIVVSEYLLEAVWGTGYENEDRVLRQAIYRLRQKIEKDPKNPQYIQTRSGLGYILVSSD